MIRTRARAAAAVAAVFGLLLAAAPVRADTTVASDTWGDAVKTLVVMPGTSISCWKDAWRALASGGETTCTPVGDGSFEMILGLTAGQTYNYLFFAQGGNPAVGGLMQSNEYYDIIPTNGPIPVSTNGRTIYTDSTSVYYQAARYGQAGNFDARRLLTVPNVMTPGETLWVFNNFGETPGVVGGVTAYAQGDTSIRIEWTSPYGYWGSGGEAFKAADILAGGRYRIYRSSTPAVADTWAFSFVESVDGDVFTYLDSGLVSGETYRYVIQCLDAYKGASNPWGDSFPQRWSDTSAADTSTTAAAFNSIFLIRAPDEEVIRRKSDLVFLSRADDPPWGPKWPARLAQAYLPRRIEFNLTGP